MLLLQENMVKLHKTKTSETLSDLYQIINDICYQCNRSINYEIVETDIATYVVQENKTVIYLLLCDHEHERMFKYNTLIYAILYNYDDALLNKAIELKYYDPKIQIESNYILLNS